MREEATVDSCELVDEAWEALDAGDAAGCARRARQALWADPAAVDAFVALALVTPVPAERMALLREGVRLGQIEHAAALKKPKDAAFWSRLETRPYMRAVHNLAIELWGDGRDPARAEAVLLGGHLLKINPNDNQGVRFSMLPWLAKLERWNDADRIVRCYAGEPRTETAYWRALLAFRNGQEEAGALLDRAMGINPHVPAPLTGRRPPQPDDPSCALRSPEEAAAFAHAAHEAWSAIPGARGWLRRQRPKALRSGHEVRIA